MENELGLSFLLDMEDGKREEYTKTLNWILDLEERGVSKWRVSNIGICKESRLPVIPTKIGYINKLESEGIVKRVYSSNSRTEYALAYPPPKVREALDELDRQEG